MKISAETSCISLLLWMIASTISANSGSSIEFLTIPKDSTMQAGLGIKSSYLPIIEYSSLALQESQHTMNYTVYTRTRSCHLSEDVSEVIWGSMQATEIWQLTNQRVLIVWSMSVSTKLPGSLKQEFSYFTKITPIDMNTCKVLNSVLIPWNPHDDTLNFVKIIPYVDGFDIISSIDSKRTLMQYDIDGNRVGEAKPFFIKGDVRDIEPASIKSRSKGLFVMKGDDDGEFQLFFTKQNGKIVKRILDGKLTDLTAQFGPDGIFGYTLCWSNSNDDETTTVNCRQFNMFGEEIYKEQKIFYSSSVQLVYVQNLKQGGFVIFTNNGNIDKLEVTAFRPDHAERSSIFELRSVSEDGFQKLVDFDETSGEFTFAYVQSNNSQDRIVLRKFQLSDWRD